VIAPLSCQSFQGSLCLSVRSQPFNILRYVHGQHYEAHMDTFDPKDFGPQATNRVSQNGRVLHILPEQKMLKSGIE